jgi:hypothetical protein
MNIDMGPGPGLVTQKKKKNGSSLVVGSCTQQSFWLKTEVTRWPLGRGQ